MIRTVWSQQIGFILMVTLCWSQVTPSVNAQGPGSRRPRAIGNSDADIPCPSLEGRIGIKDANAMAEIKEAMVTSLRTDGSGFELRGIVTTGTGDRAQQSQAIVVVEEKGKVRFDILGDAEQRSMRMSGRYGQVRSSDGKVQMLQDGDITSLFATPSQIWESVNRQDVGVSDDGIVTVEKNRLHKITVITYKNDYSHNNAQNTIATTFYFEPDGHYLVKTASIVYGANDSVHEHLRVITYSDYRKTEASGIIPFHYSETDDGQPVMTFVVTKASTTQRHDDSYFTFTKGEK